MVSKKSTAVNFERLEEFVEDAIQCEDLYWKRNSAKFRAVAQKVGSYDEFKDMVDAAHLRPLDKDDKSSLGKSKTVWNNAVKPINADLAMNDLTVKNEMEQSVQDITSPDAFIKYWKSLPETNKKTGLVMFSNEPIQNMFQIEIPGMLFQQILAETANQLISEPSIENQCIGKNILSFIATTKRFSLSLKFLPKPARNHIEQIINNISDCPDDLKQSYS